MARAIEWGLQRELDSPESTPNLAINVGHDGCNYQIRQVAETVARELGNIEIVINEDAAPDKRSYQVDFSLYGKLAPHHGPQVSLNRSISELAEGLRRMNFDDPDFRDSQYMRLRIIADHQSRNLLNEDLKWTESA